MKPTTIREEKDSIIVESPILAVKLDTNRIVYAQARYLDDNQFRRVSELPKEIKKASHKRVFLYQFHQNMQEKVLSDSNLTEGQESKVKEQKESDEQNSIEEKSQNNEEEN